MVRVSSGNFLEMYDFMLLTFTVLMLLTAYPTMLWLVREPSFSRLLAVELWFSFIFGSYNDVMVVFLTEIMPVSVRTSGFALADSLATAILGGFTPPISTYLIHRTGDRDSGNVAVLRSCVWSCRFLI